MHHLCGFSHGAAGIGHALAELFAATGDARFCGGRRARLRLRAVVARSRPGPGRTSAASHAAGRDVPLPTADSWCNGAAGIALSRLRAAELLGDGARCTMTPTLALAACELRCAELLAPRSATTSPSATARPARQTRC